MDFQNAIKELQNTLVVVSEIQRRQAEVQKLETAEDRREMLRKEMAEHERRMARIEQSLREAGERLKRLTAE
jgi:hypothetical protein